MDKSKFIKPKFILPALLLISIVFIWQHNKNERLEEILAGKYVKINKTVIAVEAADSPGEQYRGLSNRASLLKDSGMLFVFQNKQQRVFVMREMNFPLDIIWIANGEIVKIDTNLKPEGKNPEKAYSSYHDIDHALEVNGGFVKKKKIKVGDKIEINI